jgi:precorrin-2 dehydrogenase/sirohydrochlorin ferrochelatase
MEYFPIFIDLRNKNVLVIGDYRVLEFKIKKMIAAGAKITYLTDLWPEQIQDLKTSDNVIFIRDQFNASYLDDKWLVVCGSDNSELKDAIVRATAEKNIFCNFVDEAPISSFISPSVISKGDITVAISTKGKSPALNKHLKKKIGEIIGEEYSKLADMLGTKRKRVIEKVPGQKNRSELFDQIVQKPEILNLIKEGKISRAEKIIDEIIDKEISRINRR